MEKYIVKWSVEAETSPQGNVAIATGDRSFDIWEAHCAIIRYENLKLEVDGLLLRPIEREASEINCKKIVIQLHHAENSSNSWLVCEDVYYTDSDNAMYAIVVLQAFGA